MKFKKIIALTLSFILVFTFISSASGWTQNIAVEFNRINIEIDGNKVYADNILYNGTTYIPLRAASNMLGFDVEWHESTDTAKLTSNVFSKQVVDLPKIYQYFEEINQFTAVSLLFSNLIKTANGKIYDYDFIDQVTTDGLTMFEMLKSLNESAEDYYYKILENKNKVYEAYEFVSVSDYENLNLMYEYIHDSYSAVSSMFSSMESFDKNRQPTISDVEIANYYLPFLDSTNVLIASLRMLNYNQLDLQNNNSSEIKLYY